MDNLLKYSVKCDVKKNIDCYWIWNENFSLSSEILNATSSFSELNICKML